MLRKTFHRLARPAKRILHESLGKQEAQLAETVRAIVREEVARIQKFECQDLPLERQRAALRSTAEYIDSHMALVPAFASGPELLAFALGQVEVPCGLYCELGVFSGSSINQIAKAISAHVYGFDSFEGLPERWRHLEAGHFSMAQLPAVPANVTLVKGWFDDTLPKFVEAHPQPVSFLHIDCDLYSSTKTVFAAFGKQIQPGTVIVFDEYFNHCGWKEGEFKAFAEFLKDSGLAFDYLGYNSFGEQVAVKIREVS